MVETKKYCPRCGVEVESNKLRCPLCNTPIQSLDEEKPDYSSKFPEESTENEKKTATKPKQKRLQIWEISSVILLIPIIVTLSINVIVQGTVNWSLYPVASILFVWAAYTIPLLLPKRIAIIAICEFIFPQVYFIVIDLIGNGRLDWYLQLGLPIAGVATIMLGLIIFGIIKVKHKGLNIVSFILFGGSIICVVIDLTVTSYTQAIVNARWSLYVLVPAVLIGGFLLYLHYRFIKGKDLKRKINP